MDVKRPPSGDRQLWNGLIAGFSELGDGVALVDRETHRCLFVNRALCLMSGYSPGQLEALPSFFSLLLPTAANRLDQDGNGPVIGADRYRTSIAGKDGRPIAVELSLKPLLAIPGRPLVALVRDITDERAREDAVLAGERKYRQLVERLPVVTYVAEPGAHGAWLYVSPQIEAMLGYTPEEWIDDPDLWALCVHPDDGDRVFDEETRLKDGEHLPDSEYRMFTRTGELIWVSDHAILRPKRENGRRLLDGLLTDITARKVAEIRLRQLAIESSPRGSAAIARRPS